MVDFVGGTNVLLFTHVWSINGVGPKLVPLTEITSPPAVFSIKSEAVKDIFFEMLEMLAALYEDRRV